MKNLGHFFMTFNVSTANWTMFEFFNTYFTDKQLLGVYVLGGVFSGITFVLSYLFIGKAGLLVGASGAIIILWFQINDRFNRL